MTKRIECDAENLETMRRLALASTDPDAWGDFVAEGDASIDAQMKRTADSNTVWCVYQRRDDGEYLCAVTGNGPDSKANAEFFGSARTMVLSLIEELERLRAAKEHRNWDEPAADRDDAERGES